MSDRGRTMCYWEWIYNLGQLFDETPDPVYAPVWAVYAHEGRGTSGPWYFVAARPNEVSAEEIATLHTLETGDLVEVKVLRVID